MTWKSSFAISREMVDDAKLDLMRLRASKFVQDYGRKREAFAGRPNSKLNPLFAVAGSLSAPITENTVFFNAPIFGMIIVSGIIPRI